MFADLTEFEKAEAQIPQIQAFVEEQRCRKLRVADRWVIDFASCNYLGLDLNQSVIASIQPALDKWGVHPSWTRAVASPALYADLDRNLMTLTGARNVLVFPSTTLAHVGLIPLIGDGNCIILKDVLAHRSIEEGCAIARARGAAFATFRHNDLDDLQSKLHESRHYRSRLIAIDAVYSMSGNYAPIDRLVQIAEEYDALLYVDDAHGIGLLGDRTIETDLPYGSGGGGSLRYHHVDPDNQHIVYVASLSKAFSSFAAFVTCGNDRLFQRFRSASTYMFCGPVTVPSLASAAAGIQFSIAAGDDLRRSVFSLSRMLVDGIHSLGLETDNNNYFPIITLKVGPTAEVVRVCRALWDFGVLVTPALFPFVGRNRGAIRFSVTAANTESEVSTCLQAIRTALV